MARQAASLLIAATLFLMSCGDDNTPPVIDSFIVPEQAVFAQQVEFEVIAHDADGDVLSYTWSVNDGVLSEETPTVTWMTPDVEMKAIVRVRISDGSNPPVEKEETITIAESVLPLPVKQDDAPMVLVPAGEFEMGSNLSPDEQPIHTVYLDEYSIDAHEVTVWRYRRFVEETGHPEPNWARVSVFATTDEHPMINVSWHDAMAYCEWAGKRLPTEAEWEKAARGGLVGKKYPWGDRGNPERTNVNSDGPELVGRYPANDYGIYDMGGNVIEWCSDWYAADYYSQSLPRNPFGPEKGAYRVARGGSFVNLLGPISARGLFPPTEQNKAVGFRCVRD